MPTSANGSFLVLLLLIALAVAILPIWFLWRIIDRTGLVGGMALLTLIPGGFLIVLGVVAFSDWPNLPRPSLDYGASHRSLS